MVMVHKALELLNKMLTEVQLDPLLKQYELSSSQALRLLQGENATAERNAHEELANLHVTLLANRRAAESFVQLFDILAAKDTKADVRAKCILAILNIAGIGTDRKNDPSALRASPPADTPENAELLDVIAETLAERRRKRSMSSYPD
jgi:hypothetical protein